MGVRLKRSEIGHLYLEQADQYTQKRQQNIVKNLTSNEVIKNDKTNIDEKYKRFEKIHDKIKFKAFGKVTIRQRRIPKDKLEVVGKDTATELLEAQQKRAQSEIADIEKTENKKEAWKGLPWQTKSTMNKEKKDGLAWQKKQKKSAKD